ncbi:Growth factor receptor domain-containing protein [Mycena sanguinolenta]|uniref:Growth factor receptor domain-containing protein n=1 Tax=Mycena sanguinolenta TaxID=230812 RepID=A0A8H6XDV4_9AGAR|nr:Growth factor receptor domain-containing protein [Mycena sanguinolenta]
MLVLPVLLSVSNLATTNTSAIVCTAGQCLQGYSNTSIGVTISAPGSPPALLLPGQYTSTTNPQLLHNLLTSSSATLSPSPGFKNSTTSLSLPLNVAQEPGLSIYSGALYSGEPAFTSIPSAPIGANASTPLTLSSLALSSDVYIAINSPRLRQLARHRLGLYPRHRAVAHQRPELPHPFRRRVRRVLAAVCILGHLHRRGHMHLRARVRRHLMRDVRPGVFGPSCAACPSGCKDCDDGPTGSGRCLDTTSANAPATCNCVNGVCNANGSCTCTAGFTTAANGTACSQCAPGFFLTSSGDCSICEIGCTSCADGTGVCTACKTGFTQDANDKTKCNAPASITSSGTTCPPGSFADGANCTPCSPSCSTCIAGTSNDCVQCAAGTYLFNGACVSADANGVCAGSALIADNNKLECDSCGAKCTSCKIPNFTSISTVNELQCTGCVPGFFLSNGQCVESCPSGQFVSPQDNLTCTACDSSCETCTGSSTFCLTCASNQLASSGKCVSTCPSNTFSSAGSCLPCSADCSTCSGASFNQCTSCPASRPVLTNGRCLPTCSKTQFFDPTSSSCIACDPSCSSCSGAGPSQCLACSASDQVLRAGTCVPAACQQSTSVVPGLGACLSELVFVPSSSDPNAAPLPSATGINTPTTTTVAARRPLAWWEILLMALGCAFIFLVIVWLWRRRARKQRAQRTARFAQNRQLDHTGWQWRLLRFGEKLFGHRRSHRAQPPAPPRISISKPIMQGESEAEQIARIRAAEEARDARDMDKLLANYEYPRGEVRVQHYHHHHLDVHRGGHERGLSMSTTSTLSAPSLYSQVTGKPNRVPEPKEPVKSGLGRDITSPASRFSGNTIDEYYLNPAPTGTTTNSKAGSKNPFWR